MVAATTIYVMYGMQKIKHWN